MMPARSGFMPFAERSTSSPVMSGMWMSEIRRSTGRRSSSSRASRPFTPPPPPFPRQDDVARRAAPRRRVDGDGAALVADDAVHDGEAEPRAFGETAVKRLGDAIQILGGG